MESIKDRLNAVPNTPNTKKVTDSDNVRKALFQDADEAPKADTPCVPRSTDQTINRIGQASLPLPKSLNQHKQ